VHVDTDSWTGLYATAGCHPTSTTEIAKRDEDEYFRELEGVIRDEIKKGDQSRLVAIGEIGLGEYPLCTGIAI
jgi:Tat protein secretion system quality control protein TatD with DNase activity